MDLGKSIRRLQDDQSMPCTKLAELLNVAPQQLSRWRGSKDLKVSVALKVAAVFGLTLDELLKHGIE